MSLTLQQPFAGLESEPFLAALVRSSQDAIVGKTMDGMVMFWNDAATRLYGYGAEEMIGRPITKLIPPQRIREFRDIMARVSRGETVRRQTQRRRRDGSLVDVAVTCSPVVDEQGTMLGVSAIAHDLSRYNRAMSELHDAHRRSEEMLSTLETLHGSAPVGLGFIDRDLRIVHVNDTLARLSGASAKDQIGRLAAETTPEMWDAVEPLFRHVIDDDTAVLNLEMSGESLGDPGHLHHWLGSYYPVHLHDEVIGIGVIVVDVTERRQAEEFREIVMNSMAEGLFTVDAQGVLTSVNDSAVRMLGWERTELMGQTMADLVLVASDDDTYADGNGELLRVRSEGREVHLEDHAYRCKSGVDLAVEISASPLRIGNAIEGAVVVFRDITEEKAERARVERELAAQSWIGRIREALDEDRLVLYTQPIVPLRGGRPSEEVLLRMIGRDGELIVPTAFLGVAETHGLIAEIDRWVVREAIRLAATGRRLDVNVSAESMMSPDLMALIAEELEQTGVDPANLVFEITETALVRDMEKGHAFALGINELGCSIALDDFGTGFGTFTHVKKLSVQLLKIDIEFVRGLCHSAANQAVVRTIVNLAQGFACETVAEGVEDVETLQLLQEFGVDYAQGYLLGRPAPITDSVPTVPTFDTMGVA